MPRKTRRPQQSETFLPGVANAADAALERVLIEDRDLRAAGLSPVVLGHTT